MCGVFPAIRKYVLDSRPVPASAVQALLDDYDRIRQELAGDVDRCPSCGIPEYMGHLLGCQYGQGAHMCARCGKPTDEHNPHCPTGDGSLVAIHDDGVFAFGTTIRGCLDCGEAVLGGPTRCVTCFAGYCQECATGRSLHSQDCPRRCGVCQCIDYCDDNCKTRCVYCGASGGKHLGHCKAPGVDQPPPEDFCEVCECWTQHNDDCKRVTGGTCRVIKCDSIAAVNGYCPNHLHTAELAVAEPTTRQAAAQELLREFDVAIAVELASGPTHSVCEGCGQVGLHLPSCGGFRFDGDCWVVGCNEDRDPVLATCRAHADALGAIPYTGDAYPTQGHPVVEAGHLRRLLRVVRDHNEALLDMLEETDR